MAKRSGGSRWSSRPHRRVVVVGVAALVAVIVGAVAVDRSVHDTSMVMRAAGVRPPPPPAYRIGSLLTSGAGRGVTYPVSLPAGYGEPTGLAVSPAGLGVWMFATATSRGGARAAVFHWSTDPAQLASYGLAPRDGTAGVDTPMVVDLSGTVWVALGDGLVAVDPSTGAVTSVRLPAVAGPGRGPGARAPAEVSALALAPGGSLVIARGGATEIQLLDPADDAVSVLALPPRLAMATGPAAVAGDGTGPLVAALTSAGRADVLGEYGPHGWRVLRRRCAPRAVSVAADELVTTGVGCAEAGLLGRSAVPVRVPGPGPTIALADGAWATATATGITLDTAGRRPVRVPIGRIAAGTAAHPRTDPTHAVAMVAAGPGEAWFVPDAGGSEVGLVQLP
jgi:hypothetical protein